MVAAKNTSVVDAGDRGLRKSHEGPDHSGRVRGLCAGHGRCRAVQHGMAEIRHCFDVRPNTEVEEATWTVAGGPGLSRWGEGCQGSAWK